jgi:glycosyltransferase involved in cell wall biosynthesis
MLSMPKVSVVIPLYNKEKHISRAINSVLTQTVHNFEIVVVDDGSKDKGADIVKTFSDPRIRLIHQANAGASAARNKGIEIARADLIAFLNADDEWMPLFLETVLKLREKYPQAGAYATYYECSVNGERIPYTRFQTVPSYLWEGILPDYFLAMVLEERTVRTSAVCVPKNIFPAIGGMFPVGQKLGEDLDVWGRIALKYPIALSNLVCVIYHEDAMNRVTDQIPLVDELPFILTAEKQIREGCVKQEIISNLQEYIAKERLREVWMFLLSGEVVRARKVLSLVKTSKFRWKKRMLSVFVAFLPIGFVTLLKKLKHRFFKKNVDGKLV